MSDKAPPPSRKLWRYSVVLETMEGKHRRYESVLLTEDDAKAERLDWLKKGFKSVEIFLDTEAVRTWERDKEAKKAERKGGKATKVGSHG